jgi:hypothetical protein
MPGTCWAASRQSEMSRTSTSVLPATVNARSVFVYFLWSLTRQFSPGTCWKGVCGHQPTEPRGAFVTAFASSGTPYLKDAWLTRASPSPADYRETAAKFQKEWHVKEPHREFAFARHVKGHALVSVINRGLVYYALERQSARNHVSCSIVYLTILTPNFHHSVRRLATLAQLEMAGGHLSEAFSPHHSHKKIK